MESQYPTIVENYLSLQNELNRLKNEQKVIRTQIQNIEPEVGKFLLNVPNYEMDLKFYGSNIERFGTDGLLKFKIKKEREGLNQYTIKEYLHSFFISIFPDKPSESLKELAEAALKHILDSRKTKKEYPVVTRVFKKRKREL